MKTSTYIEYKGTKVDDKTFVTKIKKFWASQGNKIKDIQTLNLYVKPEEQTVYFVINDTTSGSLPMED